MVAKIVITRSRTGVYHRSYERSNSAFCNGRSMNVYAASQADIERALPASFCSKCFPKGKPE
jgi:hypothetical protein